MNEVIQTIKARRSVRAYDTDKQIDDSLLSAILEAGRYAPTAHNEQPWHFTVVQNKALMEEINLKGNALLAKFEDAWVRSMGENPQFRASYNAPTVIFVAAKKGAMSAQTDCSAAIQNMMLAAQSFGIGSVWVGLLWPYLNTPDAPVDLQLPEGYTPLHAIAFGYASGPKLPAPVRKEDVVNYIR